MIGSSTSNSRQFCPPLGQLMQATASQISIPSASIKFNDMDSAIDMYNTEHSIHAPKTEERLEQISNERYMQRKLQEEEDEDDEEDDPMDNFNYVGSRHHY